ncbi:uncharacterized protein B0I36DRAFT_121204 [Microdochium trichocladiopsis]|uniref:Uncharacterized protein n=1 Tax=Microdochium trichocladiopsis TaxID=1682393 RepID=A0A9P8Y6R1_9PEZI|nr:uncharacterized protein B0I36DRAFT_121204 [Microdochium trichocladiopsis]KAH7031299.1 hypothetical protein B0I36DRAFT_121204 [Microdochium trichocladiopsis]
MQPTTGLTAPSTSLHQPTLSNFALSSKLAKSYRDQSITETKEKKPQITYSIGIKLYFTEYYEEVIYGEPSPIYTILHQHRISGPKRLIINEKWEDHSALIQFLFDTHKISEGLRQKQWKFIAPLPASNCLKVVHLGLDETASISIAQIRDYSGSDRKGDDIFVTTRPTGRKIGPGTRAGHARGAAHPWLHKHSIMSAGRKWIAGITTDPRRSRITGDHQGSKTIQDHDGNQVIQGTTMKDKGYIAPGGSPRKQSLPLYFSDQSKYHSHPSLDLVTQLTRV